MCKFQSLYYNDDGYVVKCNECNRYQVAYLSTMLSLSEEDFSVLIQVMQIKCAEGCQSLAPHCKSVVVNTPAQDICMLLTHEEANRFKAILEEADVEAKTQAMISLFNP